MDGPVAAEGGWRLEIHGTLPSTNDLCIARAEAGAPGGLAVLARRQTAGRGSRGRRWLEPPNGNLALSVLLREPMHREAGLWPFVAGLALLDGLQAVSPARLTLKWPNDVLLHGAKLGGVLIERGVRDGDGWLVIGFGANLAEAPALPDRSTACLADAGPAPSQRAAAEAVLRALSDWRASWRTRGFEPVREAWLGRAHPPGSRLAVAVRGAQREGSFAGIDRDGALLLAVGGSVERVGTGEVLLLDGTR